MNSKYKKISLLFAIAFLCVIITPSISATVNPKYISFTSNIQEDENFLKNSFAFKADFAEDFNETTRTSIKNATKKIEETNQQKTLSTEKNISQTTSQKTNINVSDTELNILAKIINAEAKGEPYNGKVAVGAVIMNRVKSPKYPNDIKSVVFAKNQFTPVSNGSYQAAVPTQDDYNAAKAALAGEDPTNGALTFYAYKYTKSSYHESLTHTATIGGHKFFK